MQQFYFLADLLMKGYWEDIYEFQPSKLTIDNFSQQKNLLEQRGRNTADAETIFKDCYLSIPMITISAQNVVGLLISRNSFNWFLDFNLTFNLTNYCELWVVAAC